MKIIVATERLCAGPVLDCPYLDRKFSECSKYNKKLFDRRLIDAHRCKECLDDYPGQIEIEWPDPAPREAA